MTWLHERMICELDAGAVDLATSQAERDRLRDENESLASKKGEEPLVCAGTDDPEVLVEQIKSLKNENDRSLTHARTMATLVLVGAMFSMLSLMRRAYALTLSMWFAACVKCSNPAITNVRNRCVHARVPVVLPTHYTTRARRPEEEEEGGGFWSTARLRNMGDFGQRRISLTAFIRDCL